MAFSKTKKQIAGSPTQSFLKLNEIRSDCIIMQDGSLRAVLVVSSTNFDLKSQEEQNALIFAYQRFLNSLEFHVQILMQSRKMNIDEYTGKLKGIMERQTNELLRMQTSEYIEFINRLVESANVMNKNFYVIVPYEEVIASEVAGGFFSKLFRRDQAGAISAREKNFAEARKQLDERASTVASNLSSSGLRVVRLNTDQLIELVYNSYNFGAGPAVDASQLPNVTITEEKPA
jgi:type IV secretory pathway VirB4 component